MVWASSAFARHYLRDLVCFLFLGVLRCFSSLGALRRTYVFSAWYWSMTSSGFPHSDIPGSALAGSSPGPFVACYVLLRHAAPRHPPFALSSCLFLFLQAASNTR